MLVQTYALAFAASLLSSCSVVAALSPQDIPADTPISSLLSSAQVHMSRGETSQALMYYDAAIARDPSEYMTFFKRATVYLAVGRTSQAAADFNKVLSLRPGFEGAHAQLGRIKVQAADWDGAKEHYLLANKSPDSKELADLEEARGAATLAEDARQAKNWDECINQANVAIIAATRALGLRKVRADCHFSLGEMEEGMRDLNSILELKPGDTSPHMTISAINFYALDDLENGMAKIRRCLKSDPESKECKKLLKQEKAVDKALAGVLRALERKDYKAAAKPLVKSGDDEGLIEDVKVQDKALRDAGVLPQTAGRALIVKLVELACQIYYEAKDEKADQKCGESISLDDSSFYGLLHQAETQLRAEEFDASIATLKKASEAHPERENIIKPLMNNAQIALKRSKTKDYYKVLGVANDADERQIKSAYRKLSKKHHPDKAAKQGLAKEEAEKKMAAINEAYEVLSNPELRARFDRGDDPNSHEQQAPFHGTHFAHGNPFMFQGQSFQFSFH